MKIVRKNVINLNQASQVLLDSKGNKSKRLVYSLIKNIKTLEDEVSAVTKAGESENTAYEEFTSKLRAEYQIYGNKNDNDELVLRSGTPGFELEDASKQEELEEKLKALQEEYKDAIDLRSVENKDYNELLNEEIELNLKMISFESLPEDIDPKIMYNLEMVITPPID
jgi:hypothetical protein